MFTDENISFTRLEDLGLADLTPLAKMAALPYRGPLLTDCTEVEGEDDDIFVDTLTVRDIHQIEEILLGGSIGIGYLYKANAAFPTGFLLNLNPINTANFLARNLPICESICLTDLYARTVYEIQKDSVNGTFHHRCQDTIFSAELLEHLDPLLKKEKPVESIPCVLIEKYDLYNDTMHGPNEGFSPAGLMMASILAYAKSETTCDIKKEPHLTACWAMGDDIYVCKVKNTPEYLASYILSRAKEEGELSFKTATGETVMVTLGGYVLMCKDGEYLRNHLIPAIHTIVSQQTKPTSPLVIAEPAHIAGIDKNDQSFFIRQLRALDIPESIALKWISWASYLAELDQNNGDPDNPKTAEKYLAELSSKFRQIKSRYGAQVARSVISLGKQHTCLFPWELNNAAKHLASAGKMEDVPWMAAEGLLEDDSNPDPVEPEALLQLFEQYEQIPRNILALRALTLMEKNGIRKEKQPFWLAELLGTTRNTTYSWFAPNRDAKLPLKVIARLALQFQVPVDWFTKESMENETATLRKHRTRPSSEAAVWKLHTEKPELSPQQIAEELGIACGTVRRHLLHYNDQKRQKEELK